MNFLPSQNLIDAENPLLKKLVPVALTIACQGLQKADSKRLMTCAALSILFAPLGWIMAVAKKLLHVAIVVAIWWFVRDEIAALGASENVVLILAMMAVFYKEIYEELLDLILYFLVLLTGGEFLRWLCNGYLSGDGLRQTMISSRPLEQLVAVMVNGMPTEPKRRYDEIMSLYLDSNEPGSAERLNELLDEYTKRTNAVLAD